MTIVGKGENMENNNNNQQVYFNPPQAQSQPQGAPAQYIPQYKPYVKKEYSPLEKKDNRFVFLFLFCAVIFSDFALFKGFHSGFTIAYALLFGVSTAYLWDKSSRVNVFSVSCGLISLAGSVTLSLFDNVFVNTIMLILIAGLFTLYCIGISSSFSRSQGNYKLLFDLFAGAVTNPLENFGDVIGSVKAGAKKGSKNFSVIIGILLAIPALFVIVPLLISSDAAFEGLVRSIAENIGIYLVEIAVALIITPFAFSFMYGKRKKLNVKENAEKKTVERKFAPSGAVSFLSVISFVYVVYLFSQLAYFFSAFKGILPEGYKHSASVFARRGFFEMFAVVAINIALISVVNAFTKRKNGKASAGVKGVSLFISLFSVLMLAISIQKMRLNIATYGYSRNRLLVCAFMLMMLIVIAFFIIHIFAPKVQYMQAIIVSCSIIFVILSFMDINAMTGNYNVRAYNDGRLKSINAQYLAELGDSTVPSLVKLTKTENKKTAAEAKMVVIKYAAESKSLSMDKYGKMTEKAADFRSYVRTRTMASNAVLDYYNSLDEFSKKDFINKYKFFSESETSYNEDSGDFYSWENDNGYQYNEKTGNYEFVQQLADEVL